MRDAGPDDLPAVVDVAGVVDPPDEGADVDVAYYEHLVSAGRLVIAEAGGIVLGYSGVIDVDGATHLADLFVHPDAHGQGIGRRAPRRRLGLRPGRRTPADVLVAAPLCAPARTSVPA